jgi:tetratricopeptide (TPR) repeat protein/tRNA A-37 threonylcarbamoyl transferase component Bud32
MTESDPSLGAFFDRVKSDLRETRHLRLLDLARACNLLTPSQSDVLRAAAAEGHSIADSDLVDRGWISQEQLAELYRRVDGDSPSTSASPLLARYELHEKLGEGAMSQVYRGVDRQLHRPVAVKLLKENLLFQETARKRFGREAESLARLDHPNVVRVFDSGESGKQLYLVMELIEGEALSSILSRKGKDLRRLLGLLEQAARGVHHAHQRGVVHRDIKPQNILVTKAGELKVADFGLAHLLDSDPGLTGTGAVLGTPLYMAPEQVRGGANLITHRTDVYALGAILYEMLTGWPPHRGGTVSEIYERIIRENPLPPHLVSDGVPWELEVITLKAVEKEPAHRYASAEEFADDLRRYLSGEPILARPVSVVTRWTRWARKRQSVLWPALAAGILFVIGASLWYGRQLRQEEAARLLDYARNPLAKASRAQYIRGASIRDFSQWVGEAEGYVERAVQLAPALPSAHHLRGEVRILKGHYEEAERSWREAVRLDPKLGSAHFRLGQVLLWEAFLYHYPIWNTRMGLREELSATQVREGAAELRVAQAEGSGFDSELQREIASAMLSYLQEKPDAVRETCRRSIERFGEKEGAEEFYWLLGLLPGTPAEQIAALDKAVEIKPMFPLAIYTRAHARARMNTPENTSRSLDDFTQAILLHPDFAEAYIFRGSLLLGKPDVPSALADFNKAITLGRGQAAAYNGRAAVRLRHLKDIDGAIADCDEAIRLQPDYYGMPYVNRAVAYYKKRNYDAALRDGARLFEIGWKPGVNEMHLIRAKCFDAKGDAQGLLAEVTQWLGPGASPERIQHKLEDLHQERLKDDTELRP